MEYLFYQAHSSVSTNIQLEKWLMGGALAVSVEP